MMRNENSRRKGMTRVVSVILAMIMLINMLTQAFATSEGGGAPPEIPENLSIKSEIVYAEDNSTAEIILDISEVDQDQLEIIKIKGPDECEIDLEKPIVEVDENKEYLFIITYVYGDEKPQEITLPVVVDKIENSADTSDEREDLSLLEENEEEETGGEEGNEEGADIAPDEALLFDGDTPRVNILENGGDGRSVELPQYDFEYNQLPLPDGVIFGTLRYGEEMNAGGVGEVRRWTNQYFYFGSIMVRRGDMAVYVGVPGMDHVYENKSIETMDYGQELMTFQEVCAILQEMQQQKVKRHGWPKEQTLYVKNPSITCYPLAAFFTTPPPLAKSFQGWHKIKIKMEIDFNLGFPSTGGAAKEWPWVIAEHDSKRCRVTVVVDDSQTYSCALMNLDGDLYADRLKNTYTLQYDANKPNGVSTTVTVPNQVKIYEGLSFGIGEPKPLTLTSDDKTTTYTFKEWNTKADGTGISYNKGGWGVSDKDMTLYAVWTKSESTKYALTYNANKPSSVSSTVTVPNRLEAYIGNNFTALGEPNPLILISDDKTTTYTFKEWNTNASGTGTPYQKGAIVPANGNITLYAVWTKSANTKYTLTYNANRPSGVSSTVTVPNRLEAYTGNNFTALGEPNPLILISDDKTTTYTFKEWNTNASGTGTPYQKGAIVSANGNITLYAVWTKSANTKYTLTYNANRPSDVSSTVTVPNRLEAYAGSSYTALGAPSPLTLTSDDKASTYTFKEWNTSASGTGGIAYAQGAVVPANGNITLYAIWVKGTNTKYTLTYNANIPNGVSTAVVMPGHSEAYPGSSYAALGAPNPLTLTSDDKATIYTFKEWNTNASGTGVSYKTGALLLASGNITLYAVWTKSANTKYALTYNANRPSGVSSTVTVPNRLEAYAGTSYAALGAPNPLTLTSDDKAIIYTFKEWNTKADGKGVPYSKGALLLANNNITLYAVWTKSANTKYALTYNANRPSGVSSTVTVPNRLEAYAGSSYAALGAPNPLTLTSDDKASTYTFKEWNTNASGTGTPYKKGAVVPANGNITLYAVWTKSANTKYTLTYNANKPNGVSQTVTVPDSLEAYAGQNFAALKVPSPQRLRTDNEEYSYEFGGWNTKADGSGITYPERTVIAAKENVTLYAVWASMPRYTLTYDANKPEGVSSEIKVPKPVSAWMGNSFGAVEAPDPMMVTNAEKTATYIFRKWNTKANGTGMSYDIGTRIVAKENIMLYAVWEKYEGVDCPYVLNIKDGTLMNARGELFEDSSNFHIDEFGDIKVFSVIDAFQGCQENHAHRLLVIGENPNAVVGLSEVTRDIEVTFNGVTAMGLIIDEVKSLTFQSVNVIGSTDTSGTGTMLTGASIYSVGKVNVQGDARVILFNPFNTEDGPSPYATDSTYTDLRLLDLIMNEPVSEDTLLNVAGEFVTLPSGAGRLAILDSVENTWLSGDVEITNEDGTTKYVRGVAEDIQDNAYLDSQFSDDNLYGNTFALENGGRTTAYGFYNKVRLPKEVRQVNASFPTSMIFNIYTNGSGNEDFGFIGPVKKMKNESYSAEDSLTIGSVTKEYAKADRKLDIGFLGAMERTDEPSGYTLADYGKVSQEEMEQTAEKPKVCLEAVANGIADNGISIAQTDTMLTTPVKWFVADGGETSLQLAVPKAFQENPAGKRFYQIPSLLDTGEQKVSGHHYLRLAFSVGDALN